MVNETLKRLARTTERRLEDLFEQTESQIASSLFRTRASSEVLQQVKELTLRGGKRLRAALLVHSAALFDERAEETPAVIDAAAALELLQTYFLIHDDIMDQDQTRRGGPSAHVALTTLTGDPQLGLSLAILAGDLAVALHQLLIARLDVKPAIHRKVVELFAEMHLDVIHGQTLDIRGMAKPIDVAEHKTSSYTTIGPIAIGAALAGASDDHISRLAALARPLGVAFQLRDDVIGIFGNPEQTGKPVGTDLKIKKNTFVLSRAFELANDEQRAAIDAAYGNMDASQAQVEQATSALIACGAYDTCQELIARLADEFIIGITACGFHPTATSFLVDAARYLAQRQQ